MRPNTLLTQFRRILFTRMSFGQQSVIVVGLVLIAKLPLFGYISDIASHFHVHYTLFLLTYAIVCLVKKQLRSALWVGLVVVFLMSEIVPLYAPQAQKPVTPNSITMTVVHMNVHTSNKRYQDVINLVHTTRPDIISLQEVDATWMTHLAPLKREYPFFREETNYGNFGIAVLSKYPITHAQTYYFASTAIPSIIANMYMGKGRQFELIATHPLPPSIKNAENTQLRDAQLKAVFSRPGRTKQPTLIVGDLNTTSWSPSFKRIQQGSNLQDSRIGFGIQPTWPTLLPLLFIPIDHVFVSPEFTVLDRYTGEHVGSDHLPVIVTLRFVPQSQQQNAQHPPQRAEKAR